MSLTQISEEEIIQEIKKKREFSSLPNSIIKQHLKKIPTNVKPKDLKLIVKKVRAVLRKTVGQYQKGKKDRGKLLEKGEITKLLKSHSSTSERLKYYPELKKRIANLKPKSILDLGCGLNPIALANPKIEYFASDIRADELKLIKQFFKDSNITGETFIYNLEKMQGKLPSADLCLIFKVLDIIKNNRTVAKKILIKLNCRNFLISFSTKKLSGRSMRSPDRLWFEQILTDLQTPYEKFSFPNELFYLIKKPKTNALLPKPKTQ